MYLQILKKDIKRKVTMNIILFLFVLLSSMFISSSVNNILTIADATDEYLNKAGVKDYLIVTLEKEGSSIRENLEDNDYVESFNIEDVLYITYKDILLNGSVLDESDGTSLIMSVNQCGVFLFDEKNEVIDAVKEKEIWISAKTMNNNNIKIGDSIKLLCGNVYYEFKVAGSFKDAALGAEMIGVTRYLINEEDYNEIATNNTDNYYLNGSVAYVDVKDNALFEKAISQKDSTIISLISKDSLKMAYIMNMILAGVLIVVSICLILIALVVLKFTISFTITQEYREIGVMKAIGISNFKIRLLYLIKYFTIAIIGTLIGFVAGIPFGKLLLESVSFSIILESKGGILINILCSLMVVLIVVLFCIRCTRKINKLSPVNAIRNGNFGERFKKKSIIKLEKVPIKTTLFMALNDVISSLKRYSIVAIAFSLCLSLQLILVNSRNTLLSDGLNKDFGFVINDLYVLDISSFLQLENIYKSENATETVYEGLEKMEQLLEENNIQAKCNYEMSCFITLKYKDNYSKSLIMQGIGSSTNQYKYYEGTPPQNDKEIALTKITANRLGANIGDKIELLCSDGTREYIVTALFQCMGNLGDGARVHESNQIKGNDMSGCLSIGINFDDEPNENEIDERKNKIKEIFNTDMVYTPGEYLDSIVGVAASIKGMEKIVMLVSVLILVFVSVLMEYSFIAKERREIAIMKAIGFKSKDIMKIHIARFVILIILAVLISLLLTVPLTEFTVGPIFNMMGASYGIEYKIVALEVYVIYPLIMALTTIISVGLTSIAIKRVKTTEVAGAE